MIRKLVFVVAAILPIAPAVAQQANADEKRVEVAVADVDAEDDKRTIIVTAKRSVDGGQVAQGSRLGILGNGNVYDTPFSTKAYTNELILNQFARSIDDIVANDPSIRTSLSSTFVLDQTSIRGFLSNTYLFDGLQGLNSYGRSAIQNFERVEIFKGPTAGLIGGVGAVGGVINLVPKRAVDKPVANATLGLRDELLASGQIDLGARFGPNGVFGARLNVYAEYGDEATGADRRYFAPQFAFDVRGEHVRVIVDASYTRTRMNALGLNLALQPGAALPHVPSGRINPAPDWYGFLNRQYFVLGTGEWDFAGTWTVYARYGHFRENKGQTLTPVVSAIDANGDFTIIGAGPDGFSSRSQTGEAGLRGTLSFAGTTHQLAASVLQLKSYDNLFYGNDTNYGPVTQNIGRGSTAPRPDTSVVINPFSEDYYGNSRTRSIAVADSVSLLGDRLKLILAARRTRIEGGGYDKSRTNPTLAALYKLPGGFSLYGNYAEALNQGDIAPDEAVNAGEQLPPYVGRQQELGVKWNAGSYGVTLDYFDITQASAILGTDNVFKPAGRQRDRGVELETFGEPVRGLRLLGGVAYIDGTQEETQDGLFDGNKALGVPEWNVNLGAELDIRAVPGLTLTARGIHTSSLFIDQQNTQRLPSWDRVDLSGRYHATIGGTPVTFRAGLNNAFDHAYFAAGGRDRFVVAAPRTWAASVTADF